MPRFALQIDLKKNRLSHCTGYPDSEPREVGAQVRAALQCDVGERTFFVRGIFHGMGGVAGFKRCLAAFTDELDAPGWAGRLRGDFTVVVWNRTSSQITAISDRVGAHRLFVHRAPNGVVTITSRIVAQIQLQSAPRLDDLGIYTMLTFGYPLDPHTLLADTRALTVGDIGRVTGGEGHIDKLALELVGLPGGITRPPTRPLPPVFRDRLRRLCLQAGVPLNRV